METINQYVLAIQKGDTTSFPLLLEKFYPLIISWLKKIHQLHTADTDDYISMAKIILLECAKSYDAGRNVPFPSYYKIRLYHAYGNEMQKKRLNCVSLGEYNNSETYDPIEKIEKENRKLLLEQSITTLTQQEQMIYKMLLKEKTASEIGKVLKLSKKTILNKKYIIIKKLRIALNEGEKRGASNG